MRLILLLQLSLFFFSVDTCLGKVGAEQIQAESIGKPTDSPSGSESLSSLEQDKAAVTGQAKERAVPPSLPVDGNNSAETEHETATDTATQTPKGAGQESARTPESAGKTERPVTTKSLSDRQVIIDDLEQLNKLNTLLIDVDDDEIVNKLLNDKLALIEDLMSELRSSGVEKLPPAASSEQLNFLSSRIAINRERGNQLAVQRDQVKREFFQIDQAIRSFLEGLLYAAHHYQSAAEVQELALTKLSEFKQSESDYKLPELMTDSKIYADLQGNYQQLQAVKNSYQDLLNYVVDNPGVIVTTHWFQLISVHSLIAFVNSMEVFKMLNFKLAPLQVDAGGILTSLLIFALVFFSYPLLFKFSRWIIENFIFDEEYGSEEVVYEELRRPVKFLLIFIGIDLATYALLYKTEYRSSLEDISFVVYTCAVIWLLFKALDCFVMVQVQKISRSNKALRRELFNLGLQITKGLMVVIGSAVVLNHFGISITAIMSTLGIGGLAFALAAKDTLSNLFGGVTLLLDNVFRMGDWVKIGDMEGTVAEIGLRSTTLRTFDNALVTIPNSVVSVSSVINWNRRAVGRRIKMYVGVTYESNMDDIRKALQDLRSMLREHPEVANPKQNLSGKRKQFRFTTHEDVQGIKSTQLVFLDRYSEYSIDILIYCFSRSVDWERWLEVKEDILFRIAAILERNNLQFAYPTQVAVLRGDIPDHPVGDLRSGLDQA